MTAEDTPIPGALNNVVRIDDERIKGHLDRAGRRSATIKVRKILDTTSGSDGAGCSSFRNSIARCLFVDRTAP